MASSKRFKDVFEFVRRIKASSGNRIEGTSSFLTRVPNNYHYYTSSRKGLQLITAARFTPKEPSNFVVDDDGKKISLGAPPPSPQSIFRRWGAWILGFFASVVLPFWKTRWERIQKIEGEAEVVAEEMDKMAKVVEKVAVVTEKVAEELAETLPENSKLQKTALVIENLSKVAAADAASAENIIQKVEVLKQDFQNLEKAVKPLISKAHSDQHSQ
ncbi:unnamed protein product [Rhodiola kirilowii]